MRALFLVSLAASLGVASVHADAQERQQDRKTSDRVLERYAECVTKLRGKTRERIDAYLAVPIGSPLDPDLVKKLIVPNCLSKAGKMTMAPQLFARALYTALYRREFADSVPTSFAVASAYDGEFAPGYIPLGAEQNYLRGMGDCVVAHDLGAAHRYVLAKVWSDEDEAILPEVVSAAAQCVKAGEALKFSAPMLKGMLAESLYKHRKGMTTMAQEADL